MLMILSLKSVGEAKIGLRNLSGLISLYFALRSWLVNISKFKYVHHGHFGTMQRFLGFTSKYCRLHFGIFDLLRVKIILDSPTLSTNLRTQPFLGLIYLYEYESFSTSMYNNLLTKILLVYSGKT